MNAQRPEDLPENKSDPAGNADRADFDVFEPSHGTAVTPERLQQVGGFEAELRELGFRRSRVRYHDKIARIEIDLEDLPRLVEPETREAVVSAGKTHGFTYITLDLAGYRTGSHTEVRTGRSLRIV